MSIAFPYPGGKARILEWLLPYFPTEGRRYVEPFAGRGNVFFGFKNLAHFESWHLNDLNTGRFFTALKRVVLADLPTAEFVELCFDELKTRALMNDPIALAIEPFVSFRSKGYKFGYQVDRYNISKVERRILGAQSMLLDTAVNISQKDWVWLPWDDYDEHDFIYLDPPYIEEDKVGYNDINHVELCNRLLETKARWILSGYNNATYHTYLGAPDASLDRQIGMSNKPGAIATECIWSNF